MEAGGTASPVMALLTRFKTEILRTYPGFVEQVLLFGSQARGSATALSDIDVLVITSQDDWRKGDEIRRIGYELDLLDDSRLSIQVLSRSHVDTLRRDNYQFINNLEQDAVTV